MSTFKQSLNHLAHIAGARVVIAILTLITFFLPRFGNWSKRVIVLTTLCSKMHRSNLLDNITMSQLNERLLKFKKAESLIRVENLSCNLELMQFDWSELVVNGVKINSIEDIKPLSNIDLKQLSGILAKQIPPSFNYGESAISADIFHLLKKAHY